MLAEGKTSKEAASILGVTPSTVDYHKYRVLRALGLHTRADLIIFAVRSHMVKLRA
jgi:DNA-binding CsgD family transcriptional regulator